MPTSNIYVRAPFWAAPDRINIRGANVYLKADKIAGTSMSVSTATTAVTGANTLFTRQLKAGDVVVSGFSGNTRVGAWRDARFVANVGSATTMNVTAVFTATDSGNVLRKVDYFAVNTAYGWSKVKYLSATGNTNGISSRTVTLQSATANSIVKGDKIVFVSGNVRATRTVTAVNGTANIVVNANVSITPANTAAIFKIEEVVYVANNLDTRIRPNA